MIDELYQDKGTTAEGVDYVNDAHLWWVRFVSGAIQPATENELELWQLAMGYKDNYEGACKNYWETYMAGTGKTIETFDGVNGATPELEVQHYRENLEAKIAELQRHNRELQEKLTKARAE